MSTTTVFAPSPDSICLIEDDVMYPGQLLLCDWMKYVLTSGHSLIVCTFENHIHTNMNNYVPEALRSRVQLLPNCCRLLLLSTNADDFERTLWPQLEVLVSGGDVTIVFESLNSLIRQFGPRKVAFLLKRLMHRTNVRNVLGILHRTASLEPICTALLTEVSSLYVTLGVEIDSLIMLNSGFDSSSMQMVPTRIRNRNKHGKMKQETVFLYLDSSVSELRCQKLRSTSDDSGSATGDSKSMSKLTSFKLELSDNEKNARDKVFLPHYAAQNKINPIMEEENQKTGQIHYVMDDVDDLDDDEEFEDPDNDLDI